MIQVLLSWAVDHWHVAESRTTLLTLPRVDGPLRVLDLDPLSFVSLLEALVREDPTHARLLDDLWAQDTADADTDADAAPEAPEDRAAARREARHREIDRVVGLFG